MMNPGEFGILSPYLSAPDVSEIMVNGPSRVFIEQAGKLSQLEKGFANEADMLRALRLLLTQSGKSLNPQYPMLDTRLNDGSRMTVTMPPVTQVVGFTIRRPIYRAQDFKDLVARGTLSQQAADCLGLAVMMRQNVLISGGTSCGKTTLLNALAAMIPKNNRIVTIEDTYEIRLPHQNWVAMETVTHGRGNVEKPIDMRVLVAHALHLRPDRILLGECRGGEALDILQAMNSGHDGSMATIHASSPQDVISRLETLVMMGGYELPLQAVRQQIQRAINIIVQMVRTGDGKRQVTAVAEVTGIDDGHVIVQDVFSRFQDRLTGESRLVPTGHVPSFVRAMEKNGMRVPDDIFER